MGEVIKFPQQVNEVAAKAPVVAMTLRREQNGKTILTNLNSLSEEELLMALLGDAIMKEKQELAKKYIGQ